MCSCNNQIERANRIICTYPHFGFPSLTPVIPAQTNEYLFAMDNTPHIMTPGGAMTFAAVPAMAGNAVFRDAAGKSYTLAEAGNYRISYTVVAQATAAASNAGFVLTADGVEIPGSAVTQTLSQIGDTATLSTVMMLRALPATVLQLTSTTAGVTATNANILLEKLS